MGLRYTGSADPATTLNPYDDLASLPDSGDDGVWALMEDTGIVMRRYKPSGGPGLWMLPWRYARATGYVDNASGIAYAILADTLANMTGRGWDVADVTAPGSITKTASNPIIVDSGASGSGGSARLRFIPTSYPTKSWLFCKINSIVGTLVNNTIVGTYDGAAQLRTSFSDGSAGGFSWRNGSGGAADKVGPLSSVSGGDWLILDLDTSSADAILEAGLMGSQSRVSSQYNDMAAVPSTYAHIFCNSTAGQHTISVDEIHWIAYT